MAKLLERSIKGLQADAGHDVFLWDDELRGFGVRARPSGIKSFIVQYRNIERRTRRLVIGRYGVMTAEQARREAKAILGEIAKGADPQEEKKAKFGDALTVGDVCTWYLEEAKAGRILGRRRRPIKASTLTMDDSRIRHHILPLLGARRIAALKRGDIEGVQADIAGGKTSKPKPKGRGGATTGGEGVASRAVSTLHAVFEHAVRLGKIETNPAKGVRRLASERRVRRLSRSEIQTLGKVMREAEADGEHPTALAAIRLLLLTGFRRMEGLALERPWLKDEEGSIHFSDTKTGMQTRVIGRAAVDLLLARPKIDKSSYFFPADVGEGHFIGIVRVLQRVCSLAQIEDVTPHTLRHTFASVAGDLGFSEMTIASLLGHSARGVTQRYVHINDALRFAADRIAEEIAALLEGRTVANRIVYQGQNASIVHCDRSDMRAHDRDPQSVRDISSYEAS